jgi:hypothetical protein
VRLGLTAIAISSALVSGGCGAGGAAGSDVAAAPAPSVTAFRYAPFAVSYRLASHNRTEQEFGGQVNTMEYVTATYLIAEAVPTGSGSTALSMRVDSLVALGPLPPGVSQAALDGVKGATFRGTLAPSGEISDFEAGQGSGPLLDQLNQSMQRFFSVVPASGAQPGQSWSDTSTIAAGGEANDLEITTVAAYTAGEWTRQGAVRVLPVSARADYTISGTGSGGGAEFVIDGTGVSWVELLLADDGRLFQRVSADTMNMTATVLSMGTIVPVTQVRADSLVVLP